MIESLLLLCCILFTTTCWFGWRAADEKAKNKANYKLWCETRAERDDWRREAVKLATRLERFRGYTP